MGGVFAKNTSLETKFPSPFGSGNVSSIDWYFSLIPLPNMIYPYTSQIVKLIDKFFCKQIPSSSKKVQDDTTTDSASCPTAVTISHTNMKVKQVQVPVPYTGRCSFTAAAGVNLPSYPDISSDSDIQNMERYSQLSLSSMVHFVYLLIHFFISKKGSS